MSVENFGDALVQALAAEMLSPRYSGTDNNGNPTYLPSVVGSIAGTIARQNETKLVAAAKEAIDMDQLTSDVAEKTVARVLELLTEKQDSYGYGYGSRSYEAEAFRKQLDPLVREKLAEKLAERALAAIDEREAAK